MADITVSVVVFALVMYELLAERLAIVFFTSARVCDETTVFSAGTMAFLG